MVADVLPDPEVGRASCKMCKAARRCCLLFVVLVAHRLEGDDGGEVDGEVQEEEEQYDGVIQPPLRCARMIRRLE